MAGDAAEAAGKVMSAALRPAEVSPHPEPGGPPPWLDCDTAGDLRGARELYLCTGLGVSST